MQKERGGGQRIYRFPPLLRYSCLLPSLVEFTLSFLFVASAHITDGTMVTMVMLYLLS